MPKSYGLLDAGSGSGLLPWSHVEEQMAGARNYWVATTRPDGRPHVMPVWGLWFDDAFYFSTGRGARKARNLSRTPYVAVHLESGDDAVIVEGAAEEITDPALLARFADAYDAKYQFRPDTSDPDQAIYALHPRVAFAWREADFPGGATRWRFMEE
jgi:PPOX class probable F420-dependent enzyme